MSEKRKERFITPIVRFLILQFRWFQRRQIRWCDRR